MDAHAHLLSLGWAGPGHALDSKPYKQKGHRGLAYDPSKASNTGNGLVKPLLISQRHARLGVGKKAHEPQAGNEWWLKGFESALGNIGKSESERSSGTSTPVPSYTGGKHSGLYSFFVKGQEMEGTIGRPDEIKPTRKRKSNALEDAQSEEDDESTRPTKSKKAKTSPEAEFEQVSEYIALRDKDEKRSRREAKLDPVEEFRKVGEYLQVRTEKERQKRKRKSEALDEAVDGPVEQEASDHVETKEERRERRRRRREEKEKLRRGETIAGDREGASQPDHEEVEDSAARAARKAERKKRREEKAAKLLGAS